MYKSTKNVSTGLCADCINCHLCGTDLREHSCSGRKTKAENKEIVDETKAKVVLEALLQKDMEKEYYACIG